MQTRLPDSAGYQIYGRGSQASFIGALKLDRGHWLLV